VSCYFAFLLPREGGLQRLLGGGDADAGAAALALGVAFFLGAAHALTPGHGKALVAAYLVGSRGRLRDAFVLSSIVTVTHTAAVFALGLALLYASQQVALDRIYPRLSLASGVLVAVVGAWLLWSRLRDYAHGHHHPPSLTHGHRHPHEHPPSHTHPSGRPGAEKAGLITLALSAGLVPCPEALVVLLFSISLRKLAFGLLLLVSFTLGLATVLIAIACAMVLAGPVIRRLAGDGPWVRRLPVISAAVVTTLGLAIAIETARRV
jgi:ABC-type nickel/cobalt efflux system permease component RcnA